MNKSICACTLHLIVIFPSHECFAGEWRDNWMNEIDRVSTLPVQQQIEKLGTAVRSKTVSGNRRLSDDQIVVGDRAGSLLLAIPGHSEYFRDKINTTRELMEANMNDLENGLYIKYQTDLEYAVTDGFQTMRQLPSVETVRVLGEFLFDERGYVREPTTTGESARFEKIKHSPVLLKAGEALDHLPIVGKPPKYKRFYDTPEDLEGWRQWYTQIKEGKRTFRFEGDPTEYDLNGPAAGQKIDRIARDRKRDKERAAGHHKSATSKGTMVDTAAALVSKPGALAGILAACGLVITAIWHFLRKRSRHAG